jgi:phytoene/squalene synthetase
MASTPELASQTWCRQLMQREAKSFTAACGFLPKAKRLALEALYGVFRTADDFADEPDLGDDERRAGLAAIARDLQNLKDPSYKSSAPWFFAARRAFYDYPIAIDDALGVVAACGREIAGVRPASIDELEAHAARLTGALARCISAVLDPGDPCSLELGERLGTAMQLTNMLRDAGRDRRNGRDYFAFAGMSEVRRLAVKREAARRARSHYAAGDALARRVQSDGSHVTLSLAIDLHRALLDRLEKKNYETNRRVKLGRVEVLCRALRVWAAALMRSGRDRYSSARTPRTRRTSFRGNPASPHRATREHARPRKAG